MIGRRAAKNTTQTGGVFILGRGRDIFCLCFCPYLIECVNKFCAGIALQICRNNAILTRVCPNIGERAPFGRFPAQHRRTSACLCRGGCKAEKGTLFSSRRGRGDGRDHRRAPTGPACGGPAGCVSCVRCCAREDVHRAAAGPGVLPMRRQAQQSLVRHGVRTHLIRRSQEKKRKDGGT